MHAGRPFLLRQESPNGCRRQNRESRAAVIHRDAKPVGASSPFRESIAQGIEAEGEAAASGGRARLSKSHNDGRRVGTEDDAGESVAASKSQGRLSGGRGRGADSKTAKAGKEKSRKDGTRGPASRRSRSAASLKRISKTARALMDLGDDDEDGSRARVQRE